MSMNNETGTPPQHIPHFQSREEVAEFWDTHSFTDFPEDLEPAEAQIADTVHDNQCILNRYHGLYPTHVSEFD